MSDRDVLCAKCGLRDKDHSDFGAVSCGIRVCNETAADILRAEIARLDARVTELQESCTREVERRRAAELVMLASGFTFDWGEEER